MHGLINRSIEGFLRHTYGDGVWRSVAHAVGADPRGFHTVRDYPDALSEALITHAARQLNKPQTDLLEDLGAWLAQLESIRRLLQFSGRDFREFLLSLEELPGRAHMLVPGLQMPAIEVRAQTSGQVQIVIPDGHGLWRSVIAGLARAMADDYGALGLIAVDDDTISVQISDDAFSEGRHFELAVRPCGGQGPRP